MLGCLVHDHVFAVDSQETLLPFDMGLKEGKKD